MRRPPAQFGQLGREGGGDDRADAGHGAQAFHLDGEFGVRGEQAGRLGLALPGAADELGAQAAQEQVGSARRPVGSGNQGPLDQRGASSVGLAAGLKRQTENTRAAAGRGFSKAVPTGRSEAGITVGAHRESTMTALKSGEGFFDFQAKISGHGKVVLHAQG